MLKQCHPVQSPFQEAKTLGRGHEGASNATRKINILIKRKHPSLIPNVHFLKNKNEEKTNKQAKKQKNKKQIHLTAGKGERKQQTSLDSPTPLEGRERARLRGRGEERREGREG